MARLKIWNETTDTWEYVGTQESAGDISALTFTPAVLTDWDSDADPGNADDALDQLAERVDDLEADSHSTHTFVVHAQIIFTIEGANLATDDEGVKPLKIYIPYVGAGATLEEVFIVLGTSPVTDHVQIGLLNNGATIFTGTTYMEIPDGSTSVSRTTNFVDGGALTKDDYLQIELVAGDDAAADLVVHVRYKWTLTGV